MNPSNLQNLLNPRSLAIVGVNNKSNAGAQSLGNAIASGFDGAIYPVNPNYESLQGKKCYPSLTALPEVPDTVVVAVPTLGAMQVLYEAADLGVPSMVFFNGGFTDAGNDAGQRRHAELLQIVSRTGMATAGPNCMGLLSRRRKFDSSFIPQPRPGPVGDISVVSQSGGLVNAFVELAFNRGLGFNYVISSGNEAVVSGAHYLEWLADDAETKVIIMVVESVKDGQRFRSALERVTRSKPVVVMKLGRSEAGRSAVLAHTGSLAGSDAAFAALCAQCGATFVETVDAAIEAAAMFTKMPMPNGDRVVIFSGSGGATALTTDLASGLGLKFLPLTPATDARMRQLFEVEKPFINPFDVGAYPLLAKNDNMRHCVETLVADESVDLIGCVLIVQRDLLPIHRKVFEQMGMVARTTDKPVILISEMTTHWRDLPPDFGMHVTGSLHDGLIAIRGLIEYAAYRRRLSTAPQKSTAPSMMVPVPQDGRSSLTEFESKTILAQAGLPITREMLVQTADEAVAAAEKIGFPVALKVQSPDLMHKTDAGALALGLKNEAELRQAVARLLANVTRNPPGQPRIDGLLVQEMVSGGVEFLLGMHRDPALGPVIVLSPGGVFVELFDKSATLSLPPVNAERVAQMIESSAATERLLAGFRGRPAADRAALIKLVCDFAAIVEGVGEHVAAIDLNPVMVLPKGQGVMIADAAIEFAPGYAP